jgi:acyl carrier protein phosphodiesterase
MNFLAHFHLATSLVERFELSAIQQISAAFLADFIRGPIPDELADTPELNEFWRALLWHRQVDSFTDHHEDFKSSKKLLQKTNRRYAPILVDIFFDHQLSNHFAKLSYSRTIFSTDQVEFANQCYKTLQEHLKAYPQLWTEEAKQARSMMENHNWLLRYASIDGLNATLIGLSSRLRKPFDLTLALQDYQSNSHEFEQNFLHFYPMLENYVFDLAKYKLAY